jgi:MFS family permease
MQKMAQAWLVLELTGSGTLLGVTLAVQQLPSLLLTPHAGVLADRVDRRKLLLWTQALAILPALTLAVPTLIGHVSLWLVLVSALALGVVDALDKPTRQTFVMDLVGREYVGNAVLLNNLVQNAGKVVGPALAGVLIATAGLSVTFWINAATYVVSFIAILRMRRADMLTTPLLPRGPGQLREGISYVWHTPALRGPLLLMFVSGTLAYNFQVMIPTLAKDTFHSGAATAGTLFTAMGAGAIIGALPAAGRVDATERRLFSSALIFSAVLVAVALAPSLTVEIACVTALGASSITFRSLGATLLQLVAEPAKRGRVMALLIVAFNGTTPIGAPLVGWLTEVWGPRWAFSMAGASTGAAALALALARRRSLRDGRAAAQESAGLMASAQESLSAADQRASRSARPSAARSPNSRSRAMPPSG